MKNLIDDRRLTATLIADPLSWRVRAVEEISVDAATHCLRRRSLQVAPLRPVLEQSVDDDDTEALIGLYVGPMPRGPLLDFGISGPRGDAWLLPRTEIAAREAEYLTLIAERCEIVVAGDLRALVEAVLAFTGSAWFVGRAPIPFEQYMNDGLGRDVSASALRGWKDVGSSCREILRPRLDEFRGYSAPENPALVIPDLIGQDVVANDDHATELLHRYLRLLTSLSAISSSGGETSRHADEFLNSLADYGNYYDMIVALAVPLDEPFLVKYSERRNLDLSAFRRAGEQELVVADAQTNHVTFEVTDPNVRIAACEAIDLNGERAFGAFVSRSNTQTQSLYAYDADREFRIRLTFRLALLRRLQFVPWFAAVLLVGLGAALIHERPSDLRTIAVVAGPAALAASVLLGREPSTLGSRLRLTSTIALSLALVSLVGSATVSYICGIV